MLIQKAPLALVHSHSVSSGRFKRSLVDFLVIEYWVREHLFGIRYYTYHTSIFPTNDLWSPNPHIVRLGCLWLHWHPLLFNSKWIECLIVGHKNVTMDFTEESRFIDNSCIVSM